MSDAIKTGIDWLTEQLATHAGASCSLTQGATVKAVRATRGTCRIERPEADGTVVQVETATMTIPTADLGGIVPKNGDLLTGDGIDYEVAAPYQGAACWQWVGAYKTAIRVFLKERNATV